MTDQDKAKPRKKVTEEADEAAVATVAIEKDDNEDVSKYNGVGGCYVIDEQGRRVPDKTQGE